MARKKRTKRHSRRRSNPASAWAVYVTKKLGKRGRKVLMLVTPSRVVAEQTARKYASDWAYSAAYMKKASAKDIQLFQIAGNRLNPRRRSRRHKR
jgi:hypothetical protein